MPVTFDSHYIFYSFKLIDC